MDEEGLTLSRWKQELGPEPLLFVRVWLFDFLIAPIIGIALATPPAVIFFPIVYLVSWGYPLVGAAIGASIHAAILVFLTVRFSWLQKPFDLWRYLLVGFLIGALAGFIATFPTDAFYGLIFRGQVFRPDFVGGTQWFTGLAGALCAAISTPWALKKAIRG